MKIHMNDSKISSVSNYLSQLILVIALAFYAGANAHAGDNNQENQASALDVAMNIVKDVKKNGKQKRRDFFNEKSSTYVSSLLCE